MENDFDANHFRLTCNFEIFLKPKLMILLLLYQIQIKYIGFFLCVFSGWFSRAHKQTETLIGLKKKQRKLCFLIYSN